MNVSEHRIFFDVVVIGGGHAGIEAAYASAKIGAKTALITLRRDAIGLMPCSPSIGGLGKSHIVCEVSALGGLMPKLCSQTYLQARMLNTSKGPAVQGLRLQIDKYAYKKAAQQALLLVDNLTIIEGMITDISIEMQNQNKKITSVHTNDGRKFLCNCVVVTTGTFLNGTVHIGQDNHSAGRMDEDAAVGLSESLKKSIGITLGRLKTGTPPRLLKKTINYAQLEHQTSDKLDYLFEFRPVSTQEKMPVYIAYTNEKTQAIIHKNLKKSSLYSATIQSVGPRYCPSIEDKIGRYPDRSRHHIFLEPEGAQSDEVYPSGLSTSLPLDVQHDYIRSIKGFKNAVISKAGYAVEYDYIQPNNLKHTLEIRTVEGLFFAGQINGTTGYEEAAGQGIIAGINAALKAQNKPSFTLDRSQSYIGVMIDDLISLGVDEPYRMFTSRAERRLLLRQDNAFARIMPYGKKLGLVDDSVYDAFLYQQAITEQSIEKIKDLGKQSQLYTLLHTVKFTESIREQIRVLLSKELNIAADVISSRVLVNIHATIRYQGYLDRERREVEKMHKYKQLALPKSFSYNRIAGLSIELQQKFAYYKPTTIAQAQLIPGVTPAAISLLIFQAKMLEK